jgi:hypothetical protein
MKKIATTTSMMVMVSLLIFIGCTKDGADGNDGEDGFSHIYYYTDSNDLSAGTIISFETSDPGYTGWSQSSHEIAPGSYTYSAIIAIYDFVGTVTGVPSDTTELSGVYVISENNAGEPGEPGEPSSLTENGADGADGADGENKCYYLEHTKESRAESAYLDPAFNLSVVRNLMCGLE